MTWSERRSAVAYQIATNPHMAKELDLPYWRKYADDAEWLNQNLPILDATRAACVYAPDGWPFELAYNGFYGVLVSPELWEMVGHDRHAIIELGDFLDALEYEDLKRIDLSTPAMKRAIKRAGLVEHGLTTDRITALQEQIQTLHQYGSAGDWTCEKIRDACTDLMHELEQMIAQTDLLEETDGR